MTIAQPPPEICDQDFDPNGDHREDPYAFFAAARRIRPVFYSDRLRAWIVTRYEDIDRVVHDSSFISRHHNPATPKTLEPELQRAFETWRGDALPMGSMDGAEHTRVRTVCGRGFTARALNQYAERITKAADDLIDGLAGRTRFDFIEAFAYPFPLTVILDVLGVPAEFHQRCREWTEIRIAVWLAQGAVPLEQQRACLKALQDFAAMSRDLVAERARAPREDLVSYMLHRPVRGHAMTAEEVVAQIPTLISAGHESTAQALAAIVHRLLKDPDGWPRLVAGDLDVDMLAEESLRYDGPLIGFFRTATKESRIGTVTIPDGARIFLAYGSGSRDGEVFEDPDSFTPGRKNARSHFAFGSGPHHCVGAALARIELSIALKRLAQRMPDLTLAPSQSPSHYARFPLRALSDFAVMPHSRPGSTPAAHE